MNDRIHELDRLIFLGWGDVPQSRIPRRVLEGAMIPGPHADPKPRRKRHYQARDYRAEWRRRSKPEPHVSRMRAVLEEIAAVRGA